MSGLEMTLQMAIRHFQQGEIAQAESLARRVTEAEPHDASAWHLLGLIIQRQEDFPEAIKCVKKAVELNPDQASYWNNLGTLYRQIEQWGEAIRCLESAIALAPSTAELHHNLGTTLVYQGNPTEAIPHLQKALELKPELADSHYAMGNAYRALGQLDQAVAFYQQAIALDPNFQEAYNNLGLVYQAMEKQGDALKAFEASLQLTPQSDDSAIARQNIALMLCQQGFEHLQTDRTVAKSYFERAKALNPQEAQAWHGLGLITEHDGSFEEAIRYYHQALELGGVDAELLNNAAVSLQQAGHINEAIRCYQQSLSFKPDSATIHTNLGVLWQSVKCYPDAIHHFREALKLAPDQAQTHSNLASALIGQRAFDEAQVAISKALQLDANQPDAHNNQGLLYHRLGRWEEAVPHFERAIALRPDYPAAHTNLGMTFLALGRWEEGWKEYQWRFQTETGKSNTRSWSQPIWDGKASLTGKTIVVYWEQGFGDTIQFVRYLPLLKAKGCRVILECSAEMQSLLRTLPSIDDCIVMGAALPEFDYQIPLLNLPAIFGTWPSELESCVPYLSAEAKALPKGRTGLKVGFVWASKRDNADNVIRSCPIDVWEPLFGVPDIAWYSLQLGESAGDVFDRHGILDLATSIQDFSDTAAYIASLDLVITVDTATAHLAGAMGKNTWVLLPQIAEWRWCHGDKQTPWYPTMRIFRQHVMGDWASAIADMKQELASLLVNA